MKLTDIKKDLKNRLSERRYVHSAGVAASAYILAEKYGYNPKKAELAGWLHDCAKEMKLEEMQDIIDELGLPDVVFHSLRHTSVTYKLKLSGGDTKAVQGASGHAQADMVTEVYGHIIDEDRRKNAEMMENAFYNKENLNPKMAALLNSLAKTMKV